MSRTKVLTTTPVIVVYDLQRAIDFYCGKLGFEDPGQWGEPPCFAMMNRNGFDLMLSLALAPAQVAPNGPHRVWDAYLRVTGIRAERAALVAAGVEIVRGPERAEYRMTELEVLDPGGHRICFGQAD